MLNGGMYKIAVRWSDFWSEWCRSVDSEMIDPFSIITSENVILD